MKRIWGSCMFLVMSSGHVHFITGSQLFRFPLETNYINIDVKFFSHDLYWESKTTPSNSVFRGFLAVPVIRGIPECYGVPVFLV